MDQFALFAGGRGRLRWRQKFCQGGDYVLPPPSFSRFSISCTYLEKLHFCGTGLFDPVPEGETVPHHSRTQPDSLCRSQSFKARLCRQICTRNDPEETASGPRDGRRSQGRAVLCSPWISVNPPAAKRVLPAHGSLRFGQSGPRASCSPLCRFACSLWGARPAERGSWEPRPNTVLGAPPRPRRADTGL